MGYLLHGDSIAQQCSLSTPFISQLKNLRNLKKLTRFHAPLNVLLYVSLLSCGVEKLLVKLK